MSVGQPGIESPNSGIYFENIELKWVKTNAAVTDDRAYRSKPIGVTLVAGSALPWLVGVVCSMLASFDYGQLVDFDVCRQSVVYSRRLARGDDPRPTNLGWTSALSVTYWAAITLVGAWLTAGYLWNRKRLGSTLLPRDRTMSRDRSGLLRDERRRTSCLSAAGGSLSDIGADDDEDVSRHNSSKRKRQTRKQSGERLSRSSQVWTFLYSTDALSQLRGENLKIAP